MFRLIFAIVTLQFFMMTSYAFASPEGVWLRANKESKISIEQCGKAYCGTVVWLNKERRGAKDKNNPNPDLQNRPIVGLQIFSDMISSGTNTYKGTLYNAEDGKTYSGGLTVVDDNTLTLRGCVLRIFCKSDTWSRTTLEVSGN